MSRELSIIKTFRLNSEERDLFYRIMKALDISTDAELFRTMLLVTSKKVLGTEDQNKQLEEIRNLRKANEQLHSEIKQFIEQKDNDLNGKLRWLYQELKDEHQSVLAELNRLKQACLSILLEAVKANQGREIDDGFNRKTREKIVAVFEQNKRKLGY